MRLRPGRKPYEYKPEPWQPTIVYHKPSGMYGEVTRVTPGGRGCPGQAHVLFDVGELWCGVKDLARV